MQAMECSTEWLALKVRAEKASRQGNKRAEEQRTHEPEPDGADVFTEILDHDGCFRWRMEMS